jgi:hypothetical protein
MKATDRSPESYTGLPMRLETVDRFVADGLQQRFFDVFNTPAAWVTSTDKAKIVDKLFAHNNNKVSYPYVFLRLNTWELSEQRMSIRHGTLRGTRVSVSEDTRTTVEMRYLPVDFQVGVEFVTNNYRDMLDFGRRWLLSGLNGGLNFQIEFGETRFDIKTIIDRNINFPLREADPENVQEYTTDGGLIMQGYISESEVIKQEIIDKVEIQMSVQDTRPESSFWKFQIPRKIV